MPRFCGAFYGRNQKMDPDPKKQEEFLKKRISFLNEQERRKKEKQRKRESEFFENFWRKNPNLWMFRPP